MAEKTEEYYVYVYIDPRNFEEFYYGKGKGSRKAAHLYDDSDSEKTRRIKAIREAGLTPIIKVIARDLMEADAFLIEKALIWKLGRNLTNISPGNFAEKFRPHDTMHLALHGFDYQNGLFLVNVGEGDHRCWEDCKEYGFLSAGQAPKWSNPMRTLEAGDIVAAYLKGKGYVGIGRILEKAVAIDSFRFKGSSLRKLPLKQPNMFQNSDNANSEYVAKIEWIRSTDRNSAKWKPKMKLFTTQLIKASLQNQKQTVEFLEKEFGIDLNNLLIGN